MCLSSPSAPPPLPDPVKPQAAKAPDVMSIYSRRKASSAISGGTTLTGPSGIDNTQLSLGKTVLGT